MPVLPGGSLGASVGETGSEPSALQDPHLSVSPHISLQLEDWRLEPMKSQEEAYSRHPTEQRGALCW